MSTRPIVVYVDDEPHNLTVFEAALPETYEIHTFDSPLKALDAVTTLNPWVVVSDQKMPGMVGVNFLEIIKRTHPLAKRVLITGYSEEDLVVDSIRKAGVHDYIRKPWDVEDLAHRIHQMVEMHQLESTLQQKTAQLERQNLDLQELTKRLDAARIEEEAMRKELEAWAPPFILSALNEKEIKFPLVKDLALVTFDLIESSKVHGLRFEDRDVRSIIIHEFSQIVIRNGGWRESHAGDSAYAHFGLIPGVTNIAASAFAVATEFRMALRNLCQRGGFEIECGIGIHFATAVNIFLHTVKIDTAAGTIIQKSFDSSCRAVDLVHRMEKTVHALPGSNIVMSAEFLAALNFPVSRIIDLGEVPLRGQTQPTHLYLKPSDKVSQDLAQEFKIRIAEGKTASKDAA